MKANQLAGIFLVVLLAHAGAGLGYGGDPMGHRLMVPLDGDEWTEQTAGTGWHWWGTGGWGAQYSIDTRDKKVGKGSLQAGGTNWSSRVTLQIEESYRDKLGNHGCLATLATNDMDLCFWLKVEWLNPDHPPTKDKGELVVVCSDGYDIDLINESRPGVKGKYAWARGQNLPWTEVRIKLKDFLFRQLVPRKPYQFEKLGTINVIGPAWSTVHIDGFHWE